MIMKSTTILEIIEQSHNSCIVVVIRAGVSTVVLVRKGRKWLTGAVTAHAKLNHFQQKRTRAENSQGLQKIHRLWFP